MMMNKCFTPRFSNKTLVSKKPKQPLRTSPRLAEKPEEQSTEPSKINEAEEVDHEDESVESLMLFSSREKPKELLGGPSKISKEEEEIEDENESVESLLFSSPEKPKELLGGPSKISEEEEEEIEDENESVSSSNEEEKEVRVVGEKYKKKRIYKKRTKEQDKAMRNAQQRATLMGDEFQSRNPNVPFFTVAMQPAYLQRKFLPIPASFIEMHMFSQGKKIKAKVEGKEGCWLLNFPKKETIGKRLTIGVSSFLRDNDFVVGDVILVELTEDVTSIYVDGKVHISRDCN